MDALTQDELIEIRKSELRSMFPDLIGYLNKSLEGFAKTEFDPDYSWIEFELGYTEEGSESSYYIYETSVDESLTINQKFVWNEQNIFWLYDSIREFICLFYPYLEFESHELEFRKNKEKKNITFRYKIKLHN